MRTSYPPAQNFEHLRVRLRAILWPRTLKVASRFFTPPPPLFTRVYGSHVYGRNTRRRRSTSRWRRVPCRITGSGRCTTCTRTSRTVRFQRRREREPSMASAGSRRSASPNSPTRCPLTRSCLTTTTSTLARAKRAYFSYSRLLCSPSSTSSRTYYLLARARLFPPKPTFVRSNLLKLTLASLAGTSSRRMDRTRAPCSSR